ncbi:MAG: elongation factor P 5-aminopentanone reductase [Clostridiaceae bacterium]
MKLNGEISIVTGASKGIGRAIAIELAKEGAFVIINYKNDEDGAIETRNMIKNIGGYSEIIKADIAIYEQSKMLIESVITKFGKIDILVNNAGVSKIGLFMDTKKEDFDFVLGTNLYGTMNCCHLVIPYMVERKKGKIINISSIWGESGASCEVLYSASKGAINSFTKALAKELAGSNIKVNAVAPGVIDTKMNSFLSQEEKEKLIEDIPIGYFGSGEDIGKVVGFLASEDSRYLTGQILRVDGGYI